MDQISLATLMNVHGTDKLFAHHYEYEYERHFGPIRDSELTILEIGIGGYENTKCGGDSLLAWRDYFQNALILGIDITDKSFLDTEDRIFTHVCDQSSPEQLREMNKRFGPFDIIIDDGSHIQEHILTTFRVMWPLLNPGGIYVIEDLATAYDPAHGGDPENPHAIRLICGLIDGLHHQFWRILQPGECDPTSIKSVHVSKELVFIYKV